MLSGLGVEALRGQVGLKSRTEAAIETPIAKAAVAEATAVAGGTIVEAAIESIVEAAIEASIKTVVDKPTVEAGSETAVETVVKGSPVGTGGINR